MAQNYTRQSSFADGDTITAALFNNEFNQVVNAFAYSASSDSSTGHKHDGTSGQGGNIPQIGDIDFLNKIVVDNTNNRWGFYVQVSGGTVEQLRIQDGAIVPVTNNDIDLGTSSLEFKDLFLDGTAHIDTLDVDVNATVAGTLGVTGATTLSSTLGVTGAITGSSTLQATTITATTAFVPDASDGASLGTTSLEFSDLFLADGALIAFGNDQDVTITHLADAGLLLNGARGLFFNDTTQYINAPNGTTLDIAATDEIELNATLIDINGAVDISGNLDVGGNLVVTGTTTFNGGTLTMGDAATDNVVFGADINSNIIPNTDDTYDLGSSSQEWRNLYIDGTANIDSLVADTADINGGTIDSAVIGGTTPAAITGTAITATGIMTATGTSVFASLDISGDIDVDGTTNLDVVDIDGAVDFGSTTAHAGNATFADNAKAIFGAGSDLQIYHDGANSYIQNVTNSLIIQNDSDDKQVIIKSDNGSGGVADYFRANGTTGEALLYHYGSSKLATTATGIDVTGSVVATQAEVGSGTDGVKLTYSAGNSTGIVDTGFTSTGIEIRTGNVQRMLVNSTGIDVTGTVTADGLEVSTATGSATPVPTEIIIKSETNASDWSDTLPWGRVNFYSQDGSTNGPKTEAAIDVTKGGAGGGVSQLSMSTCNSTTGSLKKRISIEPNGDISFYEDTGTTPKLVWKSADERLGIGTSSPAEPLHVQEGSSGITQKAGTVALIEGSGNTKVTIASGSTSTGELLFGRSTDNDAGRIIYDHNNNSLSSYTNNTLAATIDSSGNVGIGTDSPTYPLTIGDGTDALETVNIIATDAGQSRLFFSDASSNGQGRLTYDHSDNHLEIYTADTESMRIDSSGNVGIGTSSPDTLAHLAAGAGSAVLRLENTDAFLSDGEVVGKIEFETQDAGGAGVNAYIQGVGVSTNGATKLEFGTGGSNSPETRMTINSNGNVGIGNPSPTDKLHLGTSSGATQLKIQSGSGINNCILHTNGTTDSWRTGMNLSLTDGSYEFYDDVNNVSRMIIDASGNVGIGTTSPTSELHLHVSGASNGAQITFDSDYGIGYVGQENNTSNNLIIGSSTAGITFYASNSEAMRILADGSVCQGNTVSLVASNYNNQAGAAWHQPDGHYEIATTSNVAPLQIGKNNAADGSLVVFRKQSTAVGSIGYGAGVLGIGQGTGNLGLFDATVIPMGSTSGAASDGVISLGGSNSRRFKNLYLSGVMAAGDGSVTAPSVRGTDTNTGLFFPSGGVTAIARNGVEGCRMDASGNFLVGKTVTAASTAGAVFVPNNYLSVANTQTGSTARLLLLNRHSGTGTAVEFRQANAGVGSISLTASATAYNTSSDQRLKENIADADDAGSKIDAIQVRKFDWKADGSHQDYGMVAQELQLLHLKLYQPQKTPKK